MDLLRGELGSSSKTHVASIVNGNAVPGIEGETVSLTAEEEAAT
jgi:hypothetical protein